MEEMMTKPALALIVTGPGSLQKGLVAMLTTVPQIQAVLVAEEAYAALRMIADHLPALVLLDMVLAGSEAGAVLNEIKATWPSTHCIILADDVRQQQEAEAAGADAVLIKGFLAAKLVATVEGLLSREKEGGADAE
jgi:DNA-binding NarL/FixJ family response regulator